jgi:hypothetical protein
VTLTPATLPFTEPWWPDFTSLVWDCAEEVGSAPSILDIPPVAATAAGLLGLLDGLYRLRAADPRYRTGRADDLYRALVAYNDALLLPSIREALAELDGLGPLRAPTT